ncbi:MAG TPA: nucleotide exchange factor GrpE [Acidimicrobiales bacterium]|nr:nucleotide exchange factor GrpE [Acidimicrobiales bacterium]
MTFPHDPADAAVPFSDEEEAAVEAALEIDLAALVQENEDRLGQLQRLQADFENFRKQAQKRVVDEVDRSTGKFVEDLLPVLDACELAFAHGVDGIEPIWSALLGALRRHGLEPLDSLGAPFNPEQHEAVMHVPTGDDGEVDEPIVSEVMRTGYTWKGRVLRPAMVTVKG